MLGPTRPRVPFEHQFDLYKERHQEALAADAEAIACIPELDAALRRADVERLRRLADIGGNLRQLALATDINRACRKLGIKLREGWNPHPPV
ncbi:hypothetical protein [Falsiroseomonas sp. E2-1-a20]|uniref:hypothetical protein n=1 Tax=Falsiroseomonas sp. E2-1-a20 TaxID=3239300 RepID=UPI003F3FA78B